MSHRSVRALVLKVAERSAWLERMKGAADDAEREWVPLSAIVEKLTPDHEGEVMSLDIEEEMLNKLRWT